MIRQSAAWPSAWNAGTVNRIPSEAELEPGCLAVARRIAKRTDGTLRAAKAPVHRSCPDIAGTLGDDRPEFASEPLQRDVRWRIIARRHPLVDA